MEKKTSYPGNILWKLTLQFLYFQLRSKSILFNAYIFLKMCIFRKSETRVFQTNVPITVTNLLGFVLTNIDPHLKIGAIWSLCLQIKVWKRQTLLYRVAYRKQTLFQALNARGSLYCKTLSIISTALFNMIKFDSTDPDNVNQMNEKYEENTQVTKY